MTHTLLSKALDVLAVCIGKITLAWAWLVETHKEYTHTGRTVNRLATERTEACAHAVRSCGLSDTSRRLQTSPSTSPAPYTTPVPALPHILVSTRLHMPHIGSVSASEVSQN